MWRNWAGDQQCVPAAVEHPARSSSCARRSAAPPRPGRPSRVTAAGHSFTDIACTDGTMIRMDRMNRVLDIDRGAGLAKVEGGIVIRDLSERLAAEGLALENLGDIDVQTVSGAISTATHGTGERFGNISSQVEARRAGDRGRLGGGVLARVRPGPVARRARGSREPRRDRQR